MGCSVWVDHIFLRGKGGGGPGKYETEIPAELLQMK